MSYSGYSGHDFVRREKMKDVLFLNELFKITTKEEIQSMSNLIDNEDLTFEQKQILELFLLRLHNHFGSWYDMLVGLMEHFDIDVVNVLKNTSMLDKCKAEKFIGTKINIMELF